MPMISLVPPISFSVFWIACPPSWTSRPSVRACFASPTTCSTSALGMSWALPVKVTWAYAVAPSLLTCNAPCGLYGLTTEATDGLVEISSSARLIRSLVAASFTEPAAVCQTTVSVSPAAAGMPAFNRSIALLDSVAGIDMLSLYLVPTAPDIAPRPTSRPTHNRTVTSRCRWHQRARTDIRSPGGRALRRAFAGASRRLGSAGWTALSGLLPGLFNPAVRAARCRHPTADTGHTATAVSDRPRIPRPQAPAPAVSRPRPAAPRTCPPPGRPPAGRGRRAPRPTSRPR